MSVLMWDTRFFVNFFSLVLIVYGKVNRLQMVFIVWSYSKAHELGAE